MTATLQTIRLHSELKPELLTAIRDSREQQPLDLSPLKMVTATLTTGDYSLVGLENVIAIERKSESDLISCVGTERTRFEKELKRMLAYPVRAIVVESSWHRLEHHTWRSRVTPKAVIASLLGWSAMGIPVVMANDHQRAGQYVAKMLFLAARRRWREARSLVDSVLEVDADE